MFEVEQTYDLRGLTILCRTARKTVRRWVRVLRAVVFAIFAVGAALTAYLLATGSFEQEDWTLPLAVAVLLGYLLFEDRLNAWIALRQMVPGSTRSVTVFDDDGYTVTTETTRTVFRYENVTSLCETERYFIFFLGKRHGQLFDKQGFRVRGPEEFRSFIGQKTGKKIQNVK